MPAIDRITGIMSMSHPVSRRTLLKRATAFGIAVPAAASLLAACGGDDDEPEDEPTTAPAATATQGSIPTPGAAQGDNATPTTGGAASPTACFATNSSVEVS